VAAALKALAEPLRLRMLSAIATDPRGESCVCDLAELADVSQPTVSHHLKVLKETVAAARFRTPRHLGLVLGSPLPSAAAP
jgi:DNA-binding transcriptional ArsR family regulator